MTYFTGKGYGVSELTDLSGRPLLTFQGPNDKKPILLSDRCAVQFDPTIQQVTSTGDLHTPRMGPSIEQRMRSVLGAGPDDELDHKIPLELGGSNLPANLMVQPGRVGGVSAASDTIETTLAERVAVGQVSLQTAWAAIALNKNFYLGEESGAGVAFSFGDALNQVIGAVGQVSTVSTAGKNGTVASETQAQINENVALMKQNPLNQIARVNFFNAQILATQQKHGLAQDEAAAAVRTLLYSYGATSGVSMADIHSTLGILEQRALQVSKSPPTIMGIESATIIKLLATVAAGAGITAIASFVLIIIGVMLAGPEAVTAAGIGYAVSSIGTAFGLSTILGIGVVGTELSAAVLIFSFLLNGLVKENYDNVVLAPTQLISAWKDAISIEKTIGTGTQMAAATGGAMRSSSSGSTGGGGGYSGGSDGGSAQIFTGVIANGVLGTPHPFASVGNGLITSDDDLKANATQTLANFVMGLPASFHYEIAIVNSVTTPAGFHLHGAPVKIIVGYHKKKTGGGFANSPSGIAYETPTYIQGLPIYKTVYKKFAVIRIFILDKNGRKVQMLENNLGIVNNTDYTPSSAALKDIAATLTPSLFTSDVNKISGLVTSTPTTITTQVATSAPVTSVVSSPPAQSSSTAAPTVSNPGDQTAIATTQYSAPIGPQLTTTPVMTTSPAAATTRLLANRQFHVKTGGVNLNVRSSPSLAGGIVQKFPDGTLVRLDQVTIPDVPVKIVSMDGYNWVAIVGVNDPYNAYGWVASEYLI